MENFIAYNPTKVHFGKGVTNELGKIAKTFGTKVLFVYGKGSAVKNGYYDKILKQLTDADLHVVEFSGVKPNPVTDDADAAIKIGIDNEVDMVVALGGGSVIDTAKVVAAAIPAKATSWNVMTHKVQITKSLPLIAVLTLAATGTEMNAFAVLQNHQTNEKIGWGTAFSYPKHSFLDPEFTYSVPKHYTSFGISDLIAHVFENFFGIGEASLTDKISAAIISDAMHYAPLVLAVPNNYDYRANIMWLSTVALNGTTAHGRKYGDWGVHAIGHTLSMMFDTPHGASLSVAYPAWLRLHKATIAPRIERLSELVFGKADADYFILELEKFFISIESPVRMSELGIGKEKRVEILTLMNQNKVSGSVCKMGNTEHEKVLGLMYGDTV